jgi:hypothetical protein
MLMGIGDRNTRETTAKIAALTAAGLMGDTLAER